MSTLAPELCAGEQSPVLSSISTRRGPRTGISIAKPPMNKNGGLQ